MLHSCLIFSHLFIAQIICDVVTNKVNIIPKYVLKNCVPSVKSNFGIENRPLYNLPSCLDFI